MDVGKLHEGDDKNKIFDVRSRIKNRKILTKRKLFEKHKNLNPDFKQNHHSLTAKINIELDIIVHD